MPRFFNPIYENATFLANQSIHKVRHFVDSNFETSWMKFLMNLDVELYKPYRFKYNSAFTDKITAVYPLAKAQNQSFTAENLPSHKARAAVQVASWANLLLDSVFRGRTVRSLINDVPTSEGITISERNALGLYVINGITVTEDCVRPLTEHWGSFVKTASVKAIAKALTDLGDVANGGLDLLSVNDAVAKFDALRDALDSISYDQCNSEYDWDSAVESYIVRSLVLKLKIYMDRFDFSKTKTVTVIDRYIYETSSVIDWMYSADAMKEAFKKYLATSSVMKTINELDALLTSSLKEVASKDGAKKLFEKHTKYACTDWAVRASINVYSSAKIDHFFDAAERVASFVVVSKGTYFEQILEPWKNTPILLRVLNNSNSSSSVEQTVDIDRQDELLNYFSLLNDVFGDMLKLFNEFIDHYFVNLGQVVSAITEKGAIQVSSEEAKEGSTKTVSSKIKFRPPVRSWSYLDADLHPHIYHMQIMEPKREFFAITQQVFSVDADTDGGAVTGVEVLDRINGDLVDSSAEHFGINKQEVITTGGTGTTVDHRSKLSKDSKYRKLWYLSFMRYEIDTIDETRKIKFKIKFDGYTLRPPLTGLKNILIEQQDKQLFNGKGVDYTYTYVPDITATTLNDATRLFTVPYDGFNKEALDGTWNNLVDGLFYGTNPTFFEHHEPSKGFVHAIEVPITRSLASRMYDDDYSKCLYRIYQRLVYPLYIESRPSNWNVTVNNKLPSARTLPADVSFNRYVTMDVPVDKRSIDTYFLMNPKSDKVSYNGKSCNVILSVRAARPNANTKKEYNVLEIIDTPYSDLANDQLIVARVTIDLSSCGFGKDIVRKRYDQGEIILKPQYFGKYASPTVKEINSRLVVVSNNGFNFKDAFEWGELLPTTLPAAILQFCKDFSSYVDAWVVSSAPKDAASVKKLFMQRIHLDDWIAALSAAANNLNTSVTISDFKEILPIASGCKGTWDSLITKMTSLAAVLNGDSDVETTEGSEFWKKYSDLVDTWTSEPVSTRLKYSKIDVIPKPYFLQDPESYFNYAFEGRNRRNIMSDPVKSIPNIFEGVLGSNHTYYPIVSSQEKDLCTRYVLDALNSYILTGLMCSADDSQGITADSRPGAVKGLPTEFVKMLGFNVD